MLPALVLLPLRQVQTPFNSSNPSAHSQVWLLAPQSAYRIFPQAPGPCVHESPSVSAVEMCNSTYKDGKPTKRKERRFIIVIDTWTRESELEQKVYKLLCSSFDNPYLQYLYLFICGQCPFPKQWIQEIGLQPLTLIYAALWRHHWGAISGINTISITIEK